MGIRNWIGRLSALLTVLALATAACGSSGSSPSVSGPSLGVYRSAADPGGADPDAGAAKVRADGRVEADVVGGRTGGAIAAPAIPKGASFSPQVRLGFTAGDQWEPAIAADASGHVYVLYPQYLGVPGCADCASPTMILLTSADRGATWSAPRIIDPAGETTGEWDAQVVVDPIDGRTVYAAWLQDRKSSIAVAKSTDFGASWTVQLVDHTNAGTDKPILAVRGSEVAVAYNHSQTVWASVSHDAGATWTSVKVNDNGNLGWSLAGGGAITAGSMAFSWAGYTRNGGAKGPVNLYVSSSTDHGATWTTTDLEVSSSPPDCSAELCGWAFLGAQATMAADGAGKMYALWNAGTAPRGPERIRFATSSDGGLSWSAAQDVSLAAPGVEHAFPAIVAGTAGAVRIGWMDERSAPEWNVEYRSSANGGASWSGETRLSTPVSGYDYITSAGFNFPFGDYFEMAIDDRGQTQVVWGEGRNYDSPGSIWYARGG